MTDPAERRDLPQEAPVAVVCNGTSQAVMMATPQDLEDFGWGFAWSEGFLSGAADVDSFELVTHGDGYEARFWLIDARAAALEARRRTMAGPVGCGLCGIDSLEQATRECRAVGDRGPVVPAAEVAAATGALRDWQPIGQRTSGLHVAGFLRPGEGLVLAREDVGRHNALDKVCGALLRSGADPADGALVTSSRVSVDLVQKCAAVGCAMLIAVSTPTERAVEAAERAGLTLVARARGGRFEVFSHGRRVG